jgi:hypothetical protein
MLQVVSGQAHNEGQQSFDNYSDELDEIYDNDADLDISLRPSNKNIRGRNPTYGHDGTKGRRTRKKRLQRLTFEQTHILEGYESYQNIMIDFKLILFLLQVYIFITNIFSFKPQKNW